MIKRTFTGLVVMLPEAKGTGVVLEAHKQNKTTYLCTIVTDCGTVIVAQVKTDSLEIGVHLEYIDYMEYAPTELSNLLSAEV